MMIVGVIDDSKDLADSIVNIFTLWFAKNRITNARAIFHLPDTDIDDNVGWLESENVSVLIIDEKLKLQAEGNILYDGHEVVEKIRKRLPDFPIFIITGFAIEDSLHNSEYNIENIIDRELFPSDPIAKEMWLSRITRAGNRFYASREETFSELTELACKIAKGVASDEDRLRINVLHEEIGIAHWSETLKDKASLLSELDSFNSGADALISKIKDVLKKEGIDVGLA